jgi:GNAT superfamily N-acetyltransferase
MAKKKPTKPAAETAANKTTVTVRCPRHDSFRVQQVAGMFDLQLPAEIVEQFAVEIPARDEPWQIGCIVGPSGSGKSSVARQAFGQELYSGRDWPADRAVVDCFELPDAGDGDQMRSIRDITGMLTAVGFSSPPSWVKPYHVLSNGEKFRCDLARALLEASARVGEGASGRLVVFDEFTSVVDRTVAKVGSAAVAKTIRRINQSPPLTLSPTPALRFVAVTCHYDVVEWLAPDWVLDMQSQSLTRGSLRRPGIPLEIFRSDSRQIWELFKKHHYLNHTIPRAARFYVGCIDQQPAALVVIAPHFGRSNPDPGYRGIRLISRIVTLPDYQGIGIGGAMLDQVAELLSAEGLQARITTSHPGMMSRLQHAPAWRVTKFALGNSKRSVATAIKRGLRRAGDKSFAGAGSRYICAAKWIGSRPPTTAAE